MNRQMQQGAARGTGLHSVIEELFPEVLEDITLVEDELFSLLEAKDPLLVELSTHLLRGGGKRLRPALTLIWGRAFEYRPRPLISVAAAVEILHMATLIHDDVVDRARVRRGVASVNARWGNRVSVLLGDYLFAMAVATVAAVGDNRVVRLLAQVVLRMSAGEIEQMSEAYNLDRTEADYLSQIDKKTACFLGECCRSGALVSSAPEAAALAARRFGYSMGMGFQIVDDILDLIGDEGELGKVRGTDLRSGLYTLPVLYSLRHSEVGPELRRVLESARPEGYSPMAEGSPGSPGESPAEAAAAADEPAGGDVDVERAIDLVIEGGGIAYSYRVAAEYIREAKASLAALPPGPARDRLYQVADFVADRNF